MSTKEEVEFHFANLASTARQAHAEMLEYNKFYANWTPEARAPKITAITVMREALQHPQNCEICTGWTGD